MKKVILVLCLTTAASLAQADFSEMNCKGREGFEGKTLSVKPLGNFEIEEGVNYPFTIKIKDGNQVLFSDIVNASQEDVMLSFKSRKGHAKLNGLIFLDELEETSMTIGKTQILFDCNSDEN